MRAPSAPATSARVWTATRSALPRSIRQMTTREQPARIATSRWVMLRRRRSARTPRPDRTTSIVEA